jgi:hypothetical protein
MENHELREPHEKIEPQWNAARRSSSQWSAENEVSQMLVYGRV